MPAHPILASAFSRALLDLFLPPACAGCGRYLPAAVRKDGERICAACRSRLRPPPFPRCSRCAAPRGTGLPAERPCTECHDWPSELRSARAAVVLASPADSLVHQFKYGGWPELATELAGRILRVVDGEGTSFSGFPLVPVPTTARRARTRGYNQAAQLARALAPLLGCELLEALARREGGTSQVSLDRSSRRANVRGAFVLLPEYAGLIDGREVVLVDDVLTTGATAIAATEMLVEGGAAGVHLLTFARTLPE